MTAWQTLSAKLQASGEQAQSGQSEEAADPREQAAAQAKVAKRIGEGVSTEMFRPTASGC